MKKLLVVLIAMMLFIPNLLASEKVKVYMFESGGCPYCEAEMEYLKGLKGYKKTFEVIRKELYVDHIDWEPGKDYDLGVKVADEFNKMGYADASYQGTPFVVISDIYAAASYSEDLETYINQAIEEGDKDAVSCIQKGKSDCVRLNPNAISGDIVEANEKAGMIVAILAVVVLAGIIVYVIKNKNKTQEVDDEEEDFGEPGEFDDDELEDEPVKEEKPKKVNKPKKTNKKVTRK